MAHTSRNTAHAKCFREPATHATRLAELKALEELADFGLRAPNRVHARVNRLPSSYDDLNVAAYFEAHK